MLRKACFTHLLKFRYTGLAVVIQNKTYLSEVQSMRFQQITFFHQDFAFKECFNLRESITEYEDNPDL